jgi:hypothetical protein
LRLPNFFSVGCHGPFWEVPGGRTKTCIHLQVAVVAVVAAALDFLFLNASVDGAVLKVLDVIFLTNLALKGGQKSASASRKHRTGHVARGNNTHPLVVLAELAAVVLHAALLGDLALLVLVVQVQAALIDLMSAVVPAENMLVLVAVVAAATVAVVPVAVVPAVSARLVAGLVTASVVLQWEVRNAWKQKGCFF